MFFIVWKLIDYPTPCIPHPSPYTLHPSRHSDPIMISKNGVKTD